MAACVTPLTSLRLSRRPAPGRSCLIRSRIVSVKAATQESQPSKAAFVGALAAAAVLLPCCRQGAAVAAEFPVAQLNSGEGVFTNNCATCHSGGNNVIESEKTLERDALVEYLDGGFSTDSIERQVKNGKGSMPAWADSLSPSDIKDVAAYVYNQAANDLW